MFSARDKVEGFDLTGYRYVNSYDLQETWKNVRKDWQHSLHNICSRTGSFPPSLARYLIERFSGKKQKVLDPFSGKGTTPLEACLSGRIGIGNDLSPEAYVITHAKVKCVSLERARAHIKKIQEQMNIEQSPRIVRKGINTFFHPKTLAQILAIREILRSDNSDESFFLRAVMCGILHGSAENSLSLPCSHSFSMSPRYVRKYAIRHRLKRPRRDVIACLTNKAEKVLVDGVPKVSGEAYMENASKLPLEDKSVDLIVTSPPYFDKQTYAWDNWLRLWFLGYDDYREIQKKLFQSESMPKFELFMSDNLREMYRVLRDDSAAFIVVGDVVLNNRKVVTAESIARISESIGFKVNRIVKDPIPRAHKYFMFTPVDKGVRVDRVVELHKGRVEENQTALPWHGRLSASPTAVNSTS